MNIPSELSENLKQGKVIPFIGAGVSRSVKSQSGEPLFPSWKELLLTAAECLANDGKNDDAGIVRGMVNKDRFLEAANEARTALGASWHDFLKSQFDKENTEALPESLELARCVWQLGSKLIITTNYDSVLQWACPDQANLRKWNIEAAVEQCDLLKKGVDKPTLWHLHGHIDDCAKIILTTDSYQGLYPENFDAGLYKAALKTLQHQLASHCFLFIGFSFADQDFGNQLKELEAIYQGAAGPHYVILPEAQRNNVKPPSKAIEFIFKDFGEPQIDLLKEMAHFVEHKSKPKLDSVADFDPDKPAFNVPFRAKGENMIGRSDALKQVRDQLCNGVPTSIGQTAAFLGLGGLGKTQLAVEYAYAYRDTYPKGVIWINADQDITVQIIKLAEDSGWVSPQSEQPFKIQIATRRLQETSDCLVIFDNLERFDTIKDYLPKPTANPHLLVTSRTEQPGFTPVGLDTLSPDEGFQLLMQVSNRKDLTETENQQAKAIVKRLDGLPLALELAGAYLCRRPSVSLEKYLGLLNDNLKLALSSNGREVSLTRHETDIHATLKINETLFQEQALLLEILDLLTWSAPAPMSLSLISATLAQEKPSFLTDALSLGEALRILQRSDGNKEEFYAMHRLVREVRRDDISLATKREWAKQSGQNLADWFEKHREDFRDLSIFEAGLDHLEAWQKNAETLQLNALEVRMIWLKAYPAFHWGRYKDAKGDIERALERYQTSNLADLALLAHLYSDLASVTSGLGDYKTAFILDEKALNIRCGLYGEDHADTANSFNNIASTFCDLKQYTKALEFGQKALNIQLKLFGEDHPDTANSFNNIAGYFSLLKKFAEALKFGQKALDIQLKLLGEDHPHTASSLDNVGGYYGDLGKKDKALEFRKKALAIRQKILGDMHPDTLTSQHNLIRSLDNFGQKPEALQRLQAQLKILKPGDPHYKRFLALKADLMPGFRKPKKKN